MSAKVKSSRAWRAALQKAIKLACPQDWNAGVRAGLYRDLSAKIELASREPPRSPMMEDAEKPKKPKKRIPRR